MAFEMKSGVEDSPSKDLIYGIEGVGKSSLAATYPAPLFLDFEGSTVKLDVSKIHIKNWATFEEVVRAIIKGDFKQFKTLVFDTADWLEKIVIEEILRLDGTKSITDDWKYSFGKGDVKVKEFFLNKVIPTVDLLMKNGFNIVFVAHAFIKGIDDPIDGRFDQYVLDMGKKPAAVLKQWCSNMFFMNYKTIVKEGKGIEKNKASGGKEVWIYTQRTPQYEAKRRDKVADSIRFIEGKNPYGQIIGVK